MGVLAECPMCHKKQSTKNKVCKCGENLDKAKRSKRVWYWVDFRLPGGKPRREKVGKSIEEARDADGKRRSQKREGRIFDMLPESKMTFLELAEWYLKLNSVKRLASYERVRVCLTNFNEMFGNRLVNSIKPVELEEYQDKREGEGLAPATIDMELTIAGTMIRKAWDNDMVDGRIVKAFRRVEGRLKPGSNARDRVLTVEEYQGLLMNALPHVKALVIVSFHTGMRRGELLNLKWEHVDREKGFIRLPAEMTKEKRPKSIPINHHVKKVLEAQRFATRACEHDYVFTYLKNPMTVRFRRSFMTACKNAGIVYGQNVKGGLRFHDIRATFDTNMERAGVRESHRKVILGHSLRGMDRHYLRLKDEDLKKAMDKYTTWIDDQFSNLDQTVDHEEKSASN